MSSINWDLMEKIFYELNPKVYKKSFNWDYQPYEIKYINKDKSLNHPFEYWVIKEEFSLHDKLLVSFDELSEWINEKKEEYPGLETKLESYSRYSSYPDTVETYCIITKETESVSKREARVKKYIMEIENLEQEELKNIKKKQASQEKKELNDYLRLKEKFEKGNKNE